MGKSRINYFFSKLFMPSVTAVERRIIMLVDFVDLTGGYDLHVHTAPSLVPRLADDTTVAKHALSLGMGGIMLKDHHESTVSRAIATQSALNDEIKVFGGVPLNTYEGGICPEVVEAVLKRGGKLVWMPTIDAAFHCKVHGGRGFWEKQRPIGELTVRNNQWAEGITILDENKKLISPLWDVLSLIKEYDVSLGTGHLSPEEIFILVKEARQLGIKKIQLTHPFLIVPNLTVQQIKELVEMGAYAEFAYVTVSPMWDYTTISIVTSTIKEVGSDHCILVSDAGQIHNPMPAECLRVFAQCLYESGIKKEQLDTMIKDNPAYLMGV